LAALRRCSRAILTSRFSRVSNSGRQWVSDLIAAVRAERAYFVTGLRSARVARLPSVNALDYLLKPSRRTASPPVFASGRDVAWRRAYAPAPLLTADESIGADGSGAAVRAWRTIWRSRRRKLPAGVAPRRGASSRPVARGLLGGVLAGPGLFAGRPAARLSAHHATREPAMTARCCMCPSSTNRWRRTAGVPALAIESR